MEKNKDIFFKLAGKPLDWLEEGLHKILSRLEKFEGKIKKSLKERSNKNREIKKHKEIAREQEFQLNSFNNTIREQTNTRNNKKESRARNLSFVIKKNRSMDRV